MTRHIRKYGIFASGSAVGAAVDYAVTLLSVRFLDLSPEIALGLAMILSATLVFFWHDRITFGAGRQAGTGRKYLIFMLWSGVVYLLRAALLFLLRQAGLPLTVALGLSILIASVLNYALSARAIFRQR